MFDYTNAFDEHDDSEEIVIEEDLTKIGKVNCDLLNIRPKPEISDSSVPITTVKKNEELLIMDGFDDYSDWYNVCTAAGIEGYALKSKIDIN